METTPVTFQCRKCSHKIQKNVKTYPPEIFSKTGTGSVLSQFWCPKCGEVSAIRYFFVRDKDGNISAQVKGWVEPMGIQLPPAGESKKDLEVEDVAEIE